MVMACLKQQKFVFSFYFPSFSSTFLLWIILLCWDNAGDSSNCLFQGYFGGNLQHKSVFSPLTILAHCSLFNTIFFHMEGSELETPNSSLRVDSALSRAAAMLKKYFFFKKADEMKAAGSSIWVQIYIYIYVYKRRCQNLWCFLLMLGLVLPPGRKVLLLAVLPSQNVLRL